MLGSMCYVVIICCLLHLISANVHNTNKVQNTENDLRELYNFNRKPTKISDVKTFCQNITCLPKCCPFSDYIYFLNATKLMCKNIKTINEELKSNFTVDYSSLNIYKKDYKNGLQLTKKTVLSDFRLYFNRKMQSKLSRTKEVNLKMNILILENGELLQVYFNRYNMFFTTSRNDFCVDELVVAGTKPEKKPLFKIFYNVNETGNAQPKDIPKTEYVMLTSAFFLLVTLVVRGLAKKKNNRVIELVQSALVSTLLCVMISKAIYKMKSNDWSSTFTFVFIIFTYFAIMSTFFWMNVLAFDTFWTICINGNKQVAKHKKAVPMKFRWYCLYAIGIPLLITIMATVIDVLDLSQGKNIYILKPHFDVALFKSDSAREIVFYIYIPMGILLFINVLLYLTIAIEIRYGNSNKKNAGKNTRDKSIVAYFRLLLLVGLTWIFEIFNLPPWLDTIATYYNCLTGVFVFFCLAFNRITFLSLCERYHIEGWFVDKIRKTIFTNT